ncbi:hypothetical protein Nepgr_020029 [Nepenthes gracilis]|uniref:Alpha/beta hydrolase fold-3 domain-containing protein n=1 Tax=Nepenthes gracilis TaxID=150966 RepID=A0AAD3SV62_NEPGR|nr:hypothetical protein Nepgr_020029 [Nepenthes gracilis]
MDSSASELIVHDFQPFFKVYKDGRIERYMVSNYAPPGFDPKTEVQSKDVAISAESNVSARIFLPKVTGRPDRKFPLLVHYHGGGFCGGSAFGSICHSFLNTFVSMANVVAVSVDYRLAPEHPLPIAYDDAWLGLQWVVSHANGHGPDPWLNEHVDFSKVFLAGESAGANIAHDVALRASVTRLDDGVKIVGLLLVHPFFGRKEPDEMYKYLCPTSSGSDDDPRLNPGVDPRLPKLCCERVLVCVAEKDWLRDRGKGYYDSLVNSGWGGVAEFVETQDADHCFFLFDPSHHKAEPLRRKFASFINDD